MDHHEQNPLGHILGGVQNRQYEVNREVEYYERTSNAVEIEAQTHTMRDYMNPTRKMPISTIVLPAHHTTLNLKPRMLQVLPQFHGYEFERPYTHLKNILRMHALFFKITHVLGKSYF